MRPACKIRLTEIRRGAACFRAEHVGHCSINVLTLPRFSGVLMVTAGPFFVEFRANDIGLNLCTHKKIVFRSGTVADDDKLCVRKAVRVAVTDSPFLKNVSITKEHSFRDHGMVKTENYVTHRSERDQPRPSGTAGSPTAIL